MSVLIVNYNYERFLPDAIESVLAQSYPNFEIVVCDDGSTDNSRSTIEKYASRDRRIRTIFKSNARVAAALNDAYQASTGEIIAMLDADDQFEPSKLERIVDRFQEVPSAGIVMDNLIKIDEQNRRVGRIPALGTFERGELRDHILRTAGHLFAAPTSAICMRRACAERVFPIPQEPFRSEADAYMRTMAALYYPVEVIEEPLTIYRVHSSNVTASRNVNLEWCERAISAAQRVYAVLQREARNHGWRTLAPIDDNPDYCEMLLVRACLLGAPATERIAWSRRLDRAAERLVSDDRKRIKAKARALKIAALLPRRFAREFLNQIYLPSRLKRFLGGKVRIR